MIRTHSMSAVLGLFLVIGAGPASALSNVDSCRTIGQSGSFRLIRNLASTNDCFVITASGVTLDLQGHTLNGSGVGSGIRVTENLQQITIRNGNVRGFNIGIELFSTRDYTVEGVHAVNNVLHGLFTSNPGEGRVVNNTFAGNGCGGISAIGNQPILIENNLVHDNALVSGGCSGILAGAGSRIVGNIVRNNGRHGIDVLCPSSVVGNTSILNNRANVGGLAFASFGAGCVQADNAFKN